MKKYLLLSFIAASLAFPLIAEDQKRASASIQIEQTASPEQKLIDEVLTDYQAGRYDSFLKQADSEYQEANKKWKYNSFLEERKKLSTLVHDYNSDKPDELQKRIAQLYKDEGRELVEICLKHPNEKFSREVRDMIFFTPSKEEQESIDFIHNLSYKFKGDGTTPLENKLINIDTEFWLKGLSLGVALAQNKVEPETFQKKHIILQIEKIKQMQEACQGDLVDLKIKKYIDTAADVLPKVHASAATRKHLHALAQGKVAPQSQAEEEMQAVVAKYLKKQEALTEKLYPTSH